MVLSRQLDSPRRLVAITVIFCTSILLVLWTAVVQQTRSARNAAVTAAIGRNDNLVVSLEQYAIRTINSADALLQIIREDYRQRGKYIDVDSLLARKIIDVSFVEGVGILDAKGRLVAGDREMRKHIGVDLSDREHFRFHQTLTVDSLFLGEPILSRTINKVVIPLSRRIVARDGSFIGTVAVQIVPRTFTYFYRHAQMRPHDLISLIAPSGITYARRTGGKESQGENISKSPLFTHVAEQPVGHYYAKDAIRGIPTYFSYRKLVDYPVIATVGVSEEDVLADFYITKRRELWFGAIASALVLLFGGTVVVALRQRQRRIEAVRKAGQLHRKEQRRLQRELTQQMIAAQERERENIGRELHDNVNQVLTTVKLYLEMVQAEPAQGASLLPRSVSYLQQCIGEIRNLSRELSAPTLGTRSIIDSIQALVEMVSAAGGMTIEFDHSRYQKPLPKEQKLAVYRILQEQLTNIQKHSGATEVRILLDQAGTESRLQISDNGRGFDPEVRGKGIGLNNIRSRAKALGGSVRIESAPGRGTTVTVSLPLPA